MTDPDHLADHPPIDADAALAPDRTSAQDKPRELGGRIGPDPTRYGDWELRGRCIDF